MRVDVSFWCLGLALMSLARGAPDDPVQKLAPVVVTAGAPPLTKLELGYRLHTARFGAIGVTDGEFIYVIGGANSADAPLEDIERFDPRTGHCEPFARLAIARRNHRAVLIDGKIYVLGGYNAVHFESNDAFEASVEVVDLKTRQVTRAPDMPVAKANFACATVLGKIYVIGGAVHRSPRIIHTNTTEVFDLATRQWHSGVPMPTPRMSMAVAVGNCVIVAGGFRGGREVADVEAFFPDENGWRVLPKLLKPVSGSSLAFADHFLLLFSGSELTAYELRSRHSESFRLGYQAPREIATVVLNGRLYVIGGTDGNRTTDDSMAAFFQAAPPPPSAPRREPGEQSAELDAVSFAETDSLRVELNRDKDYSARADIQVFELRKTVR